MYRLSRLISITPIIRSSNAILPNEEVFGVVDVLVWTSLDTVDYLVPYALANCDVLTLHPRCGYKVHTRGSRSIRIARGMYRVSSDW